MSSQLGEILSKCESGINYEYGLGKGSGEIVFSLLFCAVEKDLMCNCWSRQTSDDSMSKWVGLIVIMSGAESQLSHIQWKYSLTQ